MIITKKVTINGTDFIHTYSDKGVKIERDGVIYDDAIDPVGLDRQYNETDIPIDAVEDT